MNSPHPLPHLGLSLYMMFTHPLMEGCVKENNLYGIYKQRSQIARICQSVSSTLQGKNIPTRGLKDIVTVEIDTPVFSRWVTGAINIIQLPIIDQMLCPLSNNIIDLACGRWRGTKVSFLFKSEFFSYTLINLLSSLHSSLLSVWVTKLVARALSPLGIRTEYVYLDL